MAEKVYIMISIHTSFGQSFEHNSTVLGTRDAAELRIRNALKYNRANPDWDEDWSNPFDAEGFPDSQYRVEEFDVE